MPSQVEIERESLPIRGRTSSVDLLLGSQQVSSSAPIVIGTAPSGMDAKTAGLCLNPHLRPTIERVNRSEDGAWLGIVEPLPSTRRAIAFIQNNHSRYYRDRYETWAGSDKVWRDWWFATLFSAIDLLDQTYGSEEIVVWHPISSSNPWGEQMYGVLLEVLVHLTNHRNLAVKRLALGCPHELTYGKLAFTAAQLREEERVLREPARSRALLSGDAHAEARHIQLFRVDVPEFGSRA